MAGQKMKTQIIISMLLALILVSAAKFPAPQGYLNDFANVLDPAAKAKVNSLLADIEQTATAEVAVVIVPSLQGDTVENFAVELFKEWGIGKKNDNGLLLLIAVEDRKYRFEVGYGLEGLLNDAKVGRIGREQLMPYLKEGNYGEGIYQSLLAISNILKGQEEVISKNETQPLDIGLIFAGVIYFILFVSLYGWFEHKKKKKAQNVMGTTHIALTIITIFISYMLFVLMCFLTIILLTIGLRKTTRGRYGFGGFGGYYGGGFSGSGGFGGFGGGSSGGGGASGGF